MHTTKCQLPIERARFMLKSELVRKTAEVLGRQERVLREAATRKEVQVDATGVVRSVELNCLSNSVMVAWRELLLIEFGGRQLTDEDAVSITVDVHAGLREAIREMYPVFASTKSRLFDESEAPHSAVMEFNDFCADTIGEEQAVCEKAAARFEELGE